MWETVQSAVEQGAAYQIEYRIRTRDGSVKWVWEQGAAHVPLADEGFLLEGFIADITHQKTTELALQERNEELERFNKLATGRELRMIELKREVNALGAELGKPPPYPLDFEDPT